MTTASREFSTISVSRGRSTGSSVISRDGLARSLNDRNAQVSLSNLFVLREGLGGHPLQMSVLDAREFSNPVLVDLVHQNSVLVALSLVSQNRSG